MGAVKAKRKKSMFVKRVMPLTGKEDEEEEEEEGVATAYPANYVSGYLNSETFIIVEGPLGGSDSPFAQFWQMVLEQQCACVVTLTQNNTAVGACHVQ